MSAYYTCMTGLTFTGGAFVTFTHSLSITPSLLVVRPIVHTGVVGVTTPLVVGTVGTNIVTIGAPLASLMNFDLEVQQVHSIL
jgi:hypothetical protein